MEEQVTVPTLEQLLFNLTEKKRNAEKFKGRRVHHRR